MIMLYSMFHEKKHTQDTIISQCGVTLPHLLKYIQAIRDCLALEKDGNQASDEQIQKVCQNNVKMNLVKKWLPEARKEENKDLYTS